MAVYSGEVSCDWCSGAFLLIRREALLGAELMDERFFLYFEEPDLCLRIKRAGWDVRHLPSMTIRHPWDREGLKARLVAQEAYAARQYMAKHFTRTARWMGILALALGHARRGAVAAAKSPRARSDAARPASRCGRFWRYTAVRSAPHAVALARRHPRGCAPRGRAVSGLRVALVTM